MDIITIGQHTITLHPWVLYTILAVIGVPFLLWVVMVITAVVMARRQGSIFNQYFKQPRYSRYRKQD